MIPTNDMKEIDRIRMAYRNRDLAVKMNIYSHLIPASLFMFQQRERILLNVLLSMDITTLSNKKILDIGCGNGSVLRDFIRYGAVPENCHGIDLFPLYIEQARKISPNITFSIMNAEQISYNDNSFDILLCFTVFTSILDSEMKKNIAAEMFRVLKMDGIILWYDFHMNNPKNPDVKGVKKKEVIELFPDCAISFKRITLAPPITRVLARFSFIFCQLIEKLPFLRTHYIGVIRKKG